MKKSAHNSHIQILAETGLLGFVPWVLLLGALALCGLSAVRSEIRDGRWNLAGLYVGFVGTVVHFWVISAHTDTAPFFVMGTLAAMVWMVRNRPFPCVADARRR